ncbi:MAG: DUF5677 domain-containing protein, partial [Gemmatimonadales bacterium]
MTASSSSLALSPAQYPCQTIVGISSAYYLPSGASAQRRPMKPTSSEKGLPRRRTLDELLTDAIKARWTEIERGRTQDQIRQLIADVSITATNQTAEEAAVVLRRQIPGVTRWYAEARDGALRATNRLWGDALAKLRVVLQGFIELGEVYAPHPVSAATVVDPNKRLVLCLLHARAARVAAEIVHLLEGGFADGAAARWRTLHEIAVVCWFVGERDEDLATRYLHHAAVHEYRVLDAYIAGCEPTSIPNRVFDEFEILREECQRLEAAFGKVFLSDFGWAAAHLRH